MNRIFYRLHTEDRENLPGLVSNYFECYAIYKGIGFWRGIGEHAACIDIIGAEADVVKVQNLAHCIKSINEQEAVYVTATPTTLFDIR